MINVVVCFVKFINKRKLIKYFWTCFCFFYCWILIVLSINKFIFFLCNFLILLNFIVKICWRLKSTKHLFNISICLQLRKSLFHSEIHLSSSMNLFVFFIVKLDYLNIFFIFRENKQKPIDWFYLVVFLFNEIFIIENLIFIKSQMEKRKKDFLFRITCEIKLLLFTNSNWMIFFCLTFFDDSWTFSFVFS